MTYGGAPEDSTEHREWLSFDSSPHETVLFDVTFLASNWTCIFGAGCPGIDEEPAPERARGCCGFGAHFTDAADRDRVVERAALLTDQQWQFRSAAAEQGPLGEDDDGAETTLLVEGACVFLNRPDFHAGPGCALHVGALEAGDEPLTWKPDVCWQIPIRVEENEDENGHTTKTLRAWLRRDWGEGGSDLGWWCTEPDGAYEGHVPAYRTLAAEVTALVGEATYKRLVERLEELGP